MRATASDCAVCQSSARKLSAARRVMRPNSSLYKRKCSAMAAACSFAVAVSLAATALMVAASGHVALRPGFGCRRGKLLGFRASRHGAGGMGAGADGGLNRVEIAGADEGLVLGGAVAGRFLAEFALLQLRISEHAVVAVRRRS